MNGEKRNNVKVKMNGRFWDSSNQTAKETIESPKEPRTRTKIPFPAQPIVQKGNEAWDRMMQLRATTERETAREPIVMLDEPAAEDTVEETVFSKRRATRVFSAWASGPIMRTVLTTGGAVAIGLLFGFLVLTVFSEKDLSESYRNVLGETVQTLTAQSQPTEGAGQQQLPAAGPVLPGGNRQVADPQPAAGGTQTDVNVQVPQIKMFVAQAGVFQPDTQPQAATEPLDKQGLPHLLYKDAAKQYVFAAAAPTRDAVLGFAASLKNKGIDVYVKEFSFPAYQGKVAVSGSSDAKDHPDLNAFFAGGSKLVQTLSAHSGQVIANAQPVLSQEEAAAMKEQHRQFLERSRLVPMQGQAAAYFSGMVNGINQAMAARDKMAEANAGKKPQSAESYAWQVQAGILAYLENYASWIQEAQKTE